MTDLTDQPSETAAYRVLARKYRPSTFADLIGQEVLVRTLTNAIESGRVAHAFVLTGVRGVGKTTTARILARALNCVGPDGAGGPTVTPCGVCPHCVEIAQDRHVDVIEMDAASRTGIDDIRELIEGVRYRPVSARTKVYIIDEVHMLSRQAFNGLLKTLEEPPEHVVFIFATTEIRKVPVTVLSRCQRFDLRRIAQDELLGHFTAIAGKEGVEAEPAALAMIARAADGSVRDGLSLLDQALARSSSGDGGAPRIEEAQVKDMLGLADRARVFDLFEAVLGGRMPEALDVLADLHRGGADPAVVLEDLLELTHFVTRAKLVPETLRAPGLPEAERTRGGGLAERLSMASLARTWQILLKGLGETRTAPSPLQAAEMVLIRLAHASDLPSPGELVERLSRDAKEGGKGASGPTAAPAGPGPSSGGPRAALAPRQDEPPLPESEPAPAAEGAPRPSSFLEVVELARARREVVLANHLAGDVHLVRFEPGRIELRPEPSAPRELASNLGRLLQEWTGERWLVSISGEPGEPTLRQRREEAEQRLRAEALEDPLVQAVMEAFPGAEIVGRRDKADAEESPDQGSKEES